MSINSHIYKHMSYDITNKLVINGDINLIQQIIGSYLSTSHEYYELDFKRTVPQPPESENENWNWYDWCIENWGTNCNACKTVVRFMDENENSVVVHFNTTTNPPDKWMKSTVEMFPTLTFRLSWIDTDYPNSGLLRGIDGNYSSEHYGNNIEMAKEFIKMEWPGLYTMYERAYKIYNLQEINVCAHEFFPNVVVKIIECKENEGVYDPVKLKISYLDPATDSDTWGIIDEPIRKNIIKKIKQIVFNYGYKTRSKENTLNIIK
jgi:hypothetical protein